MAAQYAYVMKDLVKSFPGAQKPVLNHINLQFYHGAKIGIVGPNGAGKSTLMKIMFAAAGLVIVNKIDLLPYVDFDLDRCASYARSVNPGVNILPLSAITGEGVPAWYEWISSQAGTPANVALSLDSVDKTYGPE